MEQFSNYRGRDLDPHEILACLNRVRYPIDDLMRSRHSKGGLPSTRVKAVQREDTHTEPTKIEGAPATSAPSLEDLVAAAVKVQSSPQANEPPTSTSRTMGAARGRGGGRFRGRGGATSNASRTANSGDSRETGCKLCGNPRTFFLRMSTFSRRE